MIRVRLLGGSTRPKTRPPPFSVVCRGPSTPGRYATLAQTDQAKGYRHRADLIVFALRPGGLV